MRKFVLVVALLALMVAPSMAQEATAETLTVYSGRNENLIAPLLAQFTEETGVQVQVVYGDTAAIANQILEEGANSPADVYIAQDAGALGALAKAGVLAALPSDVIERVPAEYVSPEGFWVGLSARARVFVYNPAQVEALGLELPTSILDLTQPEYAGLVGWAPANASFQANVTAMRLQLGEEATAQWLADMVANGTVSYGSSNTNLNVAVANGEVVFGLTNHYYMHNLKKETPDLALEQAAFAAGDAGALVNIAGAGVLTTSDQPGLSQRLVLYLLGNSAQTYFTENTSEYPLVAGIETNPALIPLTDFGLPAINLSDLDDLAGTLTVIETSGALDE
ncbi:MAG: extracellular solute-binding protein [Anaerolineae bacterium]|jgi:iron(III) transport system substrate-binding protein|nr:extracellular solute-binding protein [Anaerolineae bacterium]